MKLIWIVARSDYHQAICREAEDTITAHFQKYCVPRGIDFEFIDAADCMVVTGGRSGGEVKLLNGQTLTKDCAVMMTPFSYSGKTNSVLKTLSTTLARGPAVFLNHISARFGATLTDKVEITSFVSQLGIPTIPTILLPIGLNLREFQLQMENFLGPPPYVLKPKESGRGYGVILANTWDHLFAVNDVLSKSEKDYIAQQFLKNMVDVRFYHFKGEVVGSITRKPDSEGYRANNGAGGQFDRGPTSTAALELLSKKIALETGAEYLAIDWLTTSDGSDGKFFFNEMCSVEAGISRLPEPQRAAVSERLFDWILEKLTENISISR